MTVEIRPTVENLQWLNRLLRNALKQANLDDSAAQAEAEALRECLAENNADIKDLLTDLAQSRVLLKEAMECLRLFVMLADGKNLCINCEDQGENYCANSPNCPHDDLRNKARRLLENSPAGQGGRR